MTVILAIYDDWGTQNLFVRIVNNFEEMMWEIEKADMNNTTDVFTVKIVNNNSSDENNVFTIYREISKPFSGDKNDKSNWDTYVKFEHGET